MRFSYAWLVEVAFVLCAGAAPMTAPCAPACEPVAMRDVRIGGFWKDHVKRITEKWLPHCIRELEPGGLGEDLCNLMAAGQALRGEAVTARHNGSRWGDAYVYNTIESICLALEVDPAGDSELARAQAHLRQKIEDWMPIILGAQNRDGYTHSYSIVGKRPFFSRISDHEFYVMGYFIEMGVAHHRMTKGADRRLYDAAIRCADHIDAIFGPAPKRTWKNGHAGLEMALCRLGRATNATEGAGKGDRYIRLAKHFIDHHHELDPSPYTQSDLPAVKLTQAMGHAVRATYLYTAMADIAATAHDEGYGAAVKALWANVVDTKLYVNGGAGSMQQHEAFGPDYFLPNHNGYSESCAACGMTFWATQMHRGDGDARHMDVQERILFNHLLGGLGLDGATFFYPIPMSSQQARYGWHVCPCCVGNIPRALLAIKDVMYALNGERNRLHVNHYVDSEGDVGGLCRIRQETGYPWDGRVTVRFVSAPKGGLTMALRIPSRADSKLYQPAPATGTYAIDVNGRPCEAPVKDGYALIERNWRAGDSVTLTLDMAIQRLRCDGRVEGNLGRVAVQRGPIVYNFESVDNGGACTYDAVLGADVPLDAAWRPDLLGGVTVVTGGGLMGIPNYARLNRGGFSATWLIEDPGKARPIPTYATALVTVSTYTSEKRKPQKLWVNDLTVSDEKWRAPQFDFFPNKGTKEWLQYEFHRPVTMRAAKVWWFDEAGKGGCAFPESWMITYQGTDGGWKPVEGVTAYPIERQKLKPSAVSFGPVTAKIFRLEMRLQPKFSAGVQEWALE